VGCEVNYQVNYDAIPDALKKLDQWVCWKAVTKPNGKVTKIPINPRTGAKASTTNPGTWGSSEEAEDALLFGAGNTDVDGTGFVFTGNDPFTGIDLDGCIQENGEPKTWAKAVIDQVTSYTEISPSGKGYHIIVEAKPKGRSHNKDGREMYDTGRYFTFTGNVFEGRTEINKREDEVDTLYKEWRKRSDSDKFDKAGKYVFDESVEIIPLDDIGLTPDMRDKFKHGIGGDPDRSKDLFAAILQMVRIGVNDETIITHCSDRQYHLGQVALSSSRGNGNMRKARYWIWSQEINKAHQVVANETQEICDGFDEINDDDFEESTEGKSSKPIQFVIANEVLKRFGLDNIVHANGRFNTWKGESGVWPHMSDQAVKQMIQKVVPKIQITKSIVDNVLSLIKTMAHIENHRFNQVNDGINTLNGTIKQVNDEWILTPHEKSEYRTSVVPIKHDPTAKAPRFLLFLDEIFRDDPDIVGKKLLFLQALGYTLLSSTPYQSIFFFTGLGANGKSVALDLFREMCGAENVSAVPMDQMNARFSRAQMDGKLANLVSELAEGQRLPEAPIKAISSGDFMTVERKGFDPYEVSLFSTLIFATNHLPHTRDLTHALQRRARIIQFGRTFSPSEQDPHLIDKLKGELPGILNLALEALKQLFVDGQFVEPQSSKDAKKEWLYQSDQVAQFVNDRCVLIVDERVSVVELYRAYRAWAVDSGIKSLLAKKSFTQRLSTSGIESTKSGNIRYYRGIKLDFEDLFGDDDDDYLSL
jgi:P4 family phage/plasmid primase-like protien